MNKPSGPEKTNRARSASESTGSKACHQDGADERIRAMAEMLDNAPGAIMIHDFEGRILYTNRKNIELHGYDSEEEFMAINLHQLDVPESEKLIAERMRLIEEKGDASFEVTHYRKDGSTFPLLIYGKKTQWQGIPALLSIASDITERRQAEEALRKSEERWQFALEGAGDGLWDWNPETDEVFYSRQWKAMLGFEEHEVGNTLAEWDKRVHPEDRKKCYADIQKHLSGESPIYINEHRMLCRDGAYKWVLDRGKVISRTPEGRPLRVIGTHADITGRRQAEEALRLQHELALALARTTDLEQALQLILSAAIDVSGADCGGIYLADETDGGMRMVLQQGLSGDFIARVAAFSPDSTNAFLVRQGRPVYAR